MFYILAPDDWVTQTAKQVELGTQPRYVYTLVGVVQNRSAELNNFDFKPGELLFASGIDVPSK